MFDFDIIRKVYSPAFTGMSSLLLLACSPSNKAQGFNELPLNSLMQCSFDSYDGEGITALEPLSIKLNGKDNSFDILNDPFERDTSKYKLDQNELAIKLSYEYHEMLEIYPHRCQYKINRVDGVGSHSCMLSETDTFQLYYPYKVECKYITATKF